VDGKAYEKGVDPIPGLHHIMPEIEPYQSMVTGEWITSRAKHQEHLKKHGMVEVGNDSSLTRPYKGMPDAAPQQRKELLIAQVNAMTNEQFKAAGRRDLERIRWQTNGIPDPLKTI
jgi:hypothetical protein